jgi:hypothetical protein
MGTWNTAINGNDTFLDIYSTFYQWYNEGESSAEASKKVLEDFSHEFEDTDTQHNALFALALAQWETKEQDKDLLERVKQIILSGKDLEVWAGLGADDKLIVKRKAVLRAFCEKITVPKDKPKRRVRKKFEFTNVTLVNITAPDGRKTFAVNENYTNSEYLHTIATIMWGDEGGSVFAFTDKGKSVSARWIDSQTLEVIHDASMRFFPKWDKSGFRGDGVNVIYIAE